MTPVLRSILAATSVANLLVNLVYPVLAVRALGTGIAADALFIVFILPNLVVVLLGNSVLNWLTPGLVRRPDGNSRRVLCWSLLWVLIGAVLLLALLLGALAAWLAAGRGADDPYALAVTVLPIGFVAVFAAVAGALAQSLFVAERAVLAAEWRTLLGNLAAVLAWFAFAPDSLESCALLFALRAVLTTILLLPRLGRPRWLDRQDAELRAILRESRWLLLAATYYKSEPFIDRLLFAAAPAGAVAAYHLAMQMIGTVTQMMQRVVVAPMIAPYAQAVHAANLPKMKRILWRAGTVMVSCGLMVWLLFACCGEWLAEMLFAGGDAGGAADTALIAQMLVLLGGYMVALLWGFVSAQVFYCAGETRVVALYSAIAYTIGIVVRVLMLWRFGVIGLVAAVSVSWVLNVLLFAGLIPRTFRRVAERGSA